LSKNFSTTSIIDGKMSQIMIMFFLLCCSVFCFQFVLAEDNCDETCEQIKFDKVKTATSGLRETCDEMKMKIDALEEMLETLEEERKWTLAFKVEAGSHICVSCAWNQPAAFNPQSYLEAIDLKKPCGCSFVNHDVLGNWTSHFQTKMTQVSVSFWNRTGDEVIRVASVLFDGRNSDSKTWFKANRVQDSSFDLLPTNAEGFHLRGGEKTSFSIQDNHPFACDGKDPDEVFNASGWMMVAEEAPPCLRTDPTAASTLSGPFPQMIYTEDRGSGKWGDDTVRHADLITVFVR